MILQVIDLRSSKVEPTPSCNTRHQHEHLWSWHLEAPNLQFSVVVVGMAFKGQEREERWRFACRQQGVHGVHTQSNTSLVNKLQVWSFHMSNKYWHLTTNPGNKHIYEHIYEQTASLIEHLMRISCLKGALAPQHSKATAERKKPLEYTEESRWHNTSGSMKQHKKMKISSGDIPQEARAVCWRQTSLGSDIWELIQNLPTIWFENFLSLFASLEPIVEASGEPPKPFVGFLSGTCSWT